MSEIDISGNESKDDDLINETVVSILDVNQQISNLETNLELGLRDVNNSMNNNMRDLRTDISNIMNSKFDSFMSMMQANLEQGMRDKKDTDAKLQDIRRDFWERSSADDKRFGDINNLIDRIEFNQEQTRGVLEEVRHKVQEGPDLTQLTQHVLNTVHSEFDVIEENLRRNMQGFKDEIIAVQSPFMVKMERDMKSLDDALAQGLIAANDRMDKQKDELMTEVHANRPDDEDWDEEVEFQEIVTPESDQPYDIRGSDSEQDYRVPADRVTHRSHASKKRSALVFPERVAEKARHHDPPDPGEVGDMDIDPSVLRSYMNTREVSMMRELLNITMAAVDQVTQGVVHTIERGSNKTTKQLKVVSKQLRSLTGGADDDEEYNDERCKVDTVIQSTF